MVKKFSMLKKYTGVLVIISFLLLVFGVIPVDASDHQPKEFNSLGKVSEDFVPDEILVKFKNDKEPFRVVKVPIGKVKEKVREYSHRPDVVYAEPNYYAQALYVPNDPNYNLQWNFGNTPASETLADGGGIGIEPAWDQSDGTGVIVAIVDTGIAYENYDKYVIAPDLAETSFVQGYNFVNNTVHANDDNSHGTHVAGTVAQSTNNSYGVAGIAFKATLMPVKVLNKRGSGTYDNIARGIRYAADNGAKVINLSLGGAYPSDTLEQALAYAHDIKHATIVAAAGNDGQGTVSYPAAYDQYVIAVGATRIDKNLSYYSNYGTSLDLVSPGGDLNVDQNNDGYGDGIVQQTFNPNTKNPKDFGLWLFQGTSMACPHVAGVAALLIKEGDATTPDQIRLALQETALDLGADGRDNTFGWGLMDATAALNWADAPNNAPAANAQTVNTPEDTPANIALTGSDADGDTLTYEIVSGPTKGTLSGTLPDVTYTPGVNYNGSDSFTFRVYDGKVYSDPAAVSITVEPVNDAPVAEAQSVSTQENTAIGITLTGTDVDGDPLIYSIATYPVHGLLSGTAPSVTYTPNTGYTGADSFSFSVSDGEFTSDDASVSLIVEPVNNAPAANAQTVNTPEDTQANITLTGSDADGDTLTYEIVSGPTKGTLSGTLPDVTYTPGVNYNGSDSFTFRVYDGKVYSDPAAVSITVEPVNDVPVAEAQSVSTQENTAIGITLTGTDVDGDPLIYSIATYPVHGLLSGTAPSVTYTPNTGYTGADSFSFSVSDGEFTSDPASVGITVTELAPENILKNAGFESGDFSFWDCVGNPTVTNSAAFSGLYGANLYKSGGGPDKNKSIAQSYTIYGNGTEKTSLFTFSAMVQMTSPGTGYMEIVQDGVVKGTATCNDRTWTFKELPRYLTIPATGATTIKVQFRVSGSGMNVDDTSVQIN